MARFTVSDVFAQTVVGPYAAWDHAIKYHPEMKDKENEAKRAIEKPVAVYLGNTAADRLFRGETLASGFWKGAFPVVVVEYNNQNIGFLRTAYLSTLEPKGAVIWPKS
jgi:hypothetical protein